MITILFYNNIWEITYLVFSFFILFFFILSHINLMYGFRIYGS